MGCCGESPNASQGQGGIRPQETENGAGHGKEAASHGLTWMQIMALVLVMLFIVSMVAPFFAR